MFRAIHLENDKEVAWRSGMLYKKGKKGLFSRANWKPRFLVLTTTSLKYYTAPNGPLKGELDLTQCQPSDIQVMPRDCLKTGTSRSSIWRIGIRTPTRRFFIAAQSATEMDGWVHDLIEITSGHGSDRRRSLDEYNYTRAAQRNVLVREPRLSV